MAVLAVLAAAATNLLQPCPTLCDPIDGSPPGSPVPGILQARTLEWVAISFSNAWKWTVKVKSLSHVQLFTTPWTAAHQAPPSMGSSRQEYWGWGGGAIAFSAFESSGPHKRGCVCVHAKSLPSCLTLCDPMDCSPPGSFVHEIFQARRQEWVAMPSSRGSSWSRNQASFSYVSCIGRQVLYH